MGIRGETEWRSASVTAPGCIAGADWMMENGKRGETMSGLRTIARPPFGDSVSVSIPAEYRMRSLEIIVLPVAGGSNRPAAAAAKSRANQELMEIVGTWVDDSETDKTLSEMRTIDAEMWK